MLHHHGAACHLFAVADIPDPEADKVTAAQFAVDSQVEEDKLAQALWAGGAFDRPGTPHAQGA